MREIHHRVKNNLQVISSLLNMQQRALTDEAARAAISDTRQRITALALIYRALYQGPDLRRVDFGEFLDELTGQLVADWGRGGPSGSPTPTGAGAGGGRRRCGPAWWVMTYDSRRSAGPGGRACCSGCDRRAKNRQRSIRRAVR